MAKVKVVIDNQGVADFLNQNKGVRDMLHQEAQLVKARAEATASDAENGPGGTIDGYAAAGFSIRWIMRDKRPQLQVISNADSKTVTAVHFHTLKKYGIAHLRAALYSITTKG